MNNDNLLFVQAVKQNNVPLVKDLIKKGSNPLASDGFAFRFSCENGFNKLFDFISSLEEYKDYKINKKTFTEVIRNNNFKITHNLIINNHLLPECFDYKLIEKSYSLSNELEITLLLFNISSLRNDLKENNPELYKKMDKYKLKYNFNEF